MMLYAACIMSSIHLIFFNYLDLQVVKINLFNKIILVKTRFIMLLEMADRSIQPDGIAKIHIITKLFKTVENLQSFHKAGKTLITITHNRHLAELLGTRFALMNEDHELNMI